MAAQRAKRVAVAVIVAVVLVAVLCATAAATPDDHLLVLDQRAGPYRYLDSFRPGKPGAYEAALNALGKPTRFRATGNLCRVTWSGEGITVGFASDLRPCRTASLFNSAWYGMTLHGRDWHNRRGVHVGDTVTRVRRLYPHASFDRASGKPWLVLLRKRIDEFNFIHLAVSVSRAGRVTAIEVPATYIF